METAAASSSEAAQTAVDAPTDQSLRVPCYCEENVWRLSVRKTRERGTDMDFYVVFVTNPEKCVPMFHQLASRDPERPCFWDYHVLLFGVSRKESRETTVFDMDSRLPYPCSLREYLLQVFPPEVIWKEKYKPCFRVIRAEKFIEHFSSDRMHMYDKETKSWSATPPTYACIKRKGENNLGIYMKISETEKWRDVTNNGEEEEDTPFGTVYNLPQLEQRFSKNVRA